MKTAVLLIMLAGCGGSKPAASPMSNTPQAPPAAAAPASQADPAPAGATAGSAGPPTVAAVRSKFEQFADKMCACKDTACTQRISDEMSRWGTEMERHGGADMKFSEDESKQIASTAERMASCMGAVAKQSEDGAKP